MANAHGIRHEQPHQSRSRILCFNCEFCASQFMCVSEMDEKNAVVTVEQSSGTTFRLVNRRVRESMMSSFVPTASAPSAPTLFVLKR